MRWCRFGTDFFVCDCEKRKMYWMYIEFFGKKQAGKDVPKMCRRINQRFLNQTVFNSGDVATARRSVSLVVIVDKVYFAEGDLEAILRPVDGGLICLNVGDVIAVFLVQLGGKETVSHLI